MRIINRYDLCELDEFPVVSIKCQGTWETRYMHKLKIYKKTNIIRSV